MIRPPLVVLAGGKGTRLGELVADKPKPMVEVCEKPFLYWLLKHYVNQGFTDITISTGYKRRVIETYPWLWNVRLLPDFREGSTDEHFCRAGHWVVNGDTYIPDSLPHVLEGPTIMIYENTDAGAQFTGLGKLHVREVPGGFYDMGTIEGLARFTEYCKTHLLSG